MILNIIKDTLTNKHTLRKCSSYIFSVIFVGTRYMNLNVCKVSYVIINQLILTIETGNTCAKIKHERDIQENEQRVCFN